MSVTSIIIGADIVPSESNHELFATADLHSLLGADLLSVLEHSDIRIFNLETPLTDQDMPIAKCGSNIIAPRDAIHGIKAMNPTLITLANNHVLDHGEQGLFSTMELLKQNKIAYVGAGNTIEEASRPYILERDGFKIGVYACAEHEFSIAGINKPGANPFDPLESLDHIMDLKKECDYVIVLYHGGTEQYRYPSPNLHKVCHKIAEKGADLIVCQHNHCISCYENYQGATIVYGQGNFLFDHWDDEYWQSGVLVKAEVSDTLHIEYIPFVKEKNCIRLAKKQTADALMEQFYERSVQILQDGFIEQQYRQFVKKQYEWYLMQCFGMGKWLTRIDQKLLKGLIVKKKSNKRHLLALQNYMECETNRELVLEGIKSCLLKQQ